MSKELVYLLTLWFNVNNVNWKGFFYYQKGTRGAILLLLILIVLTLIFNTLLRQQYRSETFLSQNDSIIKEFAEFRESLKVKENAGQRVGEDYRSQNNHYAYEDSKESDSLLKDNHYSTSRESYFSNYPIQEKLSVGETISLNETDTTLWKKIPGIGSSYSSRIVKYRELLGGFVHKEQLMEVYGIEYELYLRIEPYITVDSNYTMLKVNKIEFRDLLRHPYLNYKQVQAIVSLRDKKGDITMIEELAILDEFTSEDIKRLVPYLKFL